MHVSAMNLAAAAAAPEVNPRLASAAHEFEASLMQEFLKPLQHDALFADNDSSSAEDDSSGSGGALMSFGSQALAKAISEHGGFGIATKILEHFQTAQPGQTSGGEVKL